MAIVTGIDIGTKNTRVVICDVGGGKLPRVIGYGIAESRGLRRGYITNVDEAARGVREAVEEAERIANVKVREAFVSVGGIGLEGITTTGAAIITRADSIITEQDIDRAIGAAEKALPQPANKRIIHATPIAFIIDGKEIPGYPAGMKGLKLEVRALIITCLEQHLDNLVRTVEEADITFLDATAAPLAASYVALSKPERVAGSILINLGSETTSIVVSENGIPISLEVIPLGSTDITNDIAIALQVSLEDAEAVKIGASTMKYPKRLLNDAIIARLDTIFDAITAHLKRIGLNGLLPAGVILIGGGALLPFLTEYAKDTMRLSAKIASVSTDIMPRIAGNKDGAPNDPGWFVAYGLCVFGASGGLGERRAEYDRWGRFRRAVTSFFRQFLP
jgi:cell division protein FtsA